MFCRTEGKLACKRGGLNSYTEHRVAPIVCAPPRAILLVGNRFCTAEEASDAEHRRPGRNCVAAGSVGCASRSRIAEPGKFCAARSQDISQESGIVARGVRRLLLIVVLDSPFDPD